MLQRMKKSMEEKDQGFTLIELLVVIVIVGILAAIAIPIFLNQRQKAVDAGIESDLKAAATAQETYYVDNQEYAPDAATLTDFKLSGDNAVDTWNADADGYCIIITNDAGSGEAFAYDSNGGGLLQGDEATCA
jgi:type IV pilus assembly protein PilA